MIRIESISIEKFRGIRELALDLRGESFGICGSNGTGKSGIVDAIEFALTGDISRLSGRGTGDLSVKKHGPHVKERERPDQARVTVAGFIPSLDLPFEITRNVKDSSNFTLEPDREDVRIVMEKVAVHPEFALSRREIIKYILAQPNDRSKDVQELLRLSDVERTRVALTKISNDERKVRDLKQQLRETARSDLLRTLELENPTPDLILEKVNAGRSVLSLEPLSELKSDTSFKEGVSEGPNPSSPQTNKAQAIAAIETILRISSEGEPSETQERRRRALDNIKGLIEDSDRLRQLRQRSLVEVGIKLIEDNLCPLCDLEWERDELLQHLQTKHDGAKQTGELLIGINNDLNHIIGEIDAHSSLVGRIAATGRALKSAVGGEALEEYRNDLGVLSLSLKDFVGNAANIEPTNDALELSWWDLPAPAKTELEKVKSGIEALPDVTDQENAKVLLTVLEQQFSRSVELKAELAEAQKRCEIADKALDIFQDRSKLILEGLYDEVAEDFTRFYRSLNQEDEGEFEGRLLPSESKLGFDVDFYGYGKFPPGAYHSEGHQDGMGLCLYLALMKRTLGDNFHFAVLDDVLMSVDTDHRREVCKLLQREFPDTQFILTTHDRVWLKFMNTEGLIKRSQTFSGWTVETGPSVWHQKNVWTEIEEFLEQEDVQKAAATLRHYLEFVATILADSLRAQVQFKGDGQYALGDLMPSVVHRWPKKIKDAIKAEESWGKDTDLLAKLYEEAHNAAQRTQTENWMINPSVHYNEWQNLGAKEFRTVVDAFHEFLATMQCEKCESYVELQPRNATAQTIRCNCGDFHINLKKKS